MQFDSKASAITSTIVEAALYGLSLPMCAITAWTFRSVRFTGRINPLMIVACALLFILSTVHVITHAAWVYIGFVSSDDQEKYFADLTSPYTTAKNIAYVLETAVGDAVLIYRCYVVWRKLWLAIPFAISACCGTALALWTMISIGHSNQTEYFGGMTSKIFYASYCLFIFSNLIPTCLLSYKLWATDRAAHRYRYGRGALRPFMHIIVECGVLYSVSLIVMIAVFRVKNYAVYVVVDMLGQIIPITFYAVILCVRVWAPISSQIKDESIVLSPSSVHFSHPSRLSRSSRTGVPQLQVHVTNLQESGSSYGMDDLKSPRSCTTSSTSGGVKFAGLDVDADLEGQSMREDGSMVGKAI